MLEFRAANIFRDKQAFLVPLVFLFTPINFVAFLISSLADICRLITMAKAAQAKRELCVRRMHEVHNASVLADTDPQGKLTFFARYPGVDKIVEDFETAHLKLIQEAAADFDTEDQIRA